LKALISLKWGKVLAGLALVGSLVLVQGLPPASSQTVTPVAGPTPAVTSTPTAPPGSLIISTEFYWSKDKPCVIFAGGVQADGHSPARVVVHSGGINRPSVNFCGGSPRKTIQDCFDAGQLALVTYYPDDRQPEVACKTP
jgi:hypothetical protein